MNDSLPRAERGCDQHASNESLPRAKNSAMLRDCLETRHHSEPKVRYSPDAPDVNRMSTFCESVRCSYNQLVDFEVDAAEFSSCHS